MYVLAIDLGASSGRHIVYYEKDGQPVYEEVYRFANGPIQSEKGLLWDIDFLFESIKQGIAVALKKYPVIDSLSIDTWGVDYVLLNGDKIIKPYYAYRNDRTNKVIDKVNSIINFGDLYKKTGIQFAPFNTIYQLYDDLESGRLNDATDFLMLPEFFSYLLTGIKKHEYTNASTTGLVNAYTKEYDLDIIDTLKLPRKLFNKLDVPGTTVGYFTDAIQKEVGGNIKVVLCPSHDTACAFESVETPENCAILSSGTWSLLGIKSKVPNTSEKSLQANFTNEGGVGYIRYLKNIMGMWIPNNIQKEIKMSIQDMVKLAKESTYNESFDVNDPSLLASSGMSNSVKALLKGREPKTTGDLIRSVYVSLAVCYTKVMKEIEECLDIKINALYIVGGGAKNLMLNELTEKYSGKKVVALPIEATAIGNIKTQLNAMKGNAK